MASRARPARKGSGRRPASSAAPWPARIGEALASDKARFWALVAFAVIVAFTGGGSRSDIVSLLVLRPVSVLFVLYAMLVVSRNELRPVRGPLAIVAGLMALSLLQLLPLPPGLWTGLPQREPVADLSAALGLADVYRPVSLDPNRTWNTLFALFVPLATILLTALQSPRYMRHLVLLLVGIGFASVAFAILQMLGQRGLYLYEITNIGRPVGLFSNRNHQAVLMAWMIPATVWALANAGPGLARVGKSSLVALVCFFVLLLFLIVLTGSRAGMLLAIPATAMAAWLVSSLSAWLRKHSAAGSRAVKYAGWGAGAVAVAFLGLIVAVLTSDRNTALSRLAEDGVVEDLRWRIFPILQQMMQDFFPFGGGFGAFENLFKIYETRDMLSSRYVNQAHNDLFQLVIEGGAAAVVLLVGALAWLAIAAWRTWRSTIPNRRQVVVFYCGSIALWLGASLVDYPLRTPLAAMIVAGLTALFARLSTSQERKEVAARPASPQ